MLTSWSDPKVLEKLKLQSDAELAPDSILKFIGSDKAIYGFSAGVNVGIGLIINGTEGAAAMSTATASASVAGGIACISISAGLVLIAAGYFAYQSNWSYETRIVMLKDKMTKDFCDKMKPMIHYNYMNIYDKMVVECEKHNKFIE